MKRLVAKLAGWGVVISAVGLSATAAPAANKGVRIRAASEAVQKALQCEIDGADQNRDYLLQSALEQVPDFPPALWLTGHVRHQNRWVKFDEFPDLLAGDRRLGEYGRRRAKTPHTVEGQLALARWCSKHKLADQGRAHLTAVLDVNPNHAEARSLLGYRQVDGVWMSQEEVQQAAVRGAELAAALREWKPKLDEIRQGLEHRSERQRQLATERLQAIDDPAAIPAMELVLSLHSEQAALTMIEVLDKINASEAAEALARQAVFSNWDPVREAAIEKLKSRDPVTYVPMLLSAMVTPIQSRAELYRAPNGRLAYRHAFYREGQRQGQLAVFETEYPLALMSAFDPTSWGARSEELDRARIADAAAKAQALEASRAQQNAYIQAFNGRICDVLSKATGQNLAASPEAWWKWWNDYNEVYTAGQKPVAQVVQRGVVRFDDPYADVPVEIPGPTGEPEEPEPAPTGPNRIRFRQGTARMVQGRQPIRYECLIAGTPVWTASGPTPIEEIRVGDLVLSQHPETGELAYKPVLKITLRPPTGLIKVVFGDRALQCSGGHPFWIAGKGWVKARDLEEGARLHTVDGTTTIRSVHLTGTEEVHNLVVADFHTYFVTEAKILTHDNTIREPTEALVPGLASHGPQPRTDGKGQSGLLAGTEPP
jgi:hypothetical protein